MTGRPFTLESRNNVSISQHRTANDRERPVQDEHDFRSHRLIALTLKRVQAPRIALSIRVATILCNKLLSVLDSAV